MGVREIFIGFSRPKDDKALFAKAIRLFEDTDFNHVYIRHQTKYGIEIVYQASGLSVNFMSGIIFRHNNVIVEEYMFLLTEEQFDKYMSFALYNVGAPYSFKLILKIFLNRFFPKFAKKIDIHPLEYVCSKLVSTILDVTDIIDNTTEEYKNLVTPRMIRDYLKRF